MRHIKIKRIFTTFFKWRIYKENIIMVASKTELFDGVLVEQASFFKALAHPARLAILKYLAETKTCISGDISDELPLSRTTVNQHLKELKDAGLIQGHVEGVKTNYCLNPEQVERVSKLLKGFLNEIKPSENYKCQ
jgi:ArsR family transcriptional regulator, arsenate/arsenite/antimonite-responsive transcriptional repressor